MHSLSLSHSCLGNGRVRCPWHGACFNTATGDIEDFPGLDSLARYEVKIVGEDVVIRASKEVQGYKGHMYMGQLVTRLLQPCQAGLDHTCDVKIELL